MCWTRPDVSSEQSNVNMKHLFTATSEREVAERRQAACAPAACSSEIDRFGFLRCRRMFQSARACEGMKQMYALSRQQARHVSSCWRKQVQLLAVLESYLVGQVASQTAGGSLEEEQSHAHDRGCDEGQEHGRDPCTLCTLGMLCAQLVADPAAAAQLIDRLHCG